MCFKNKFIFTVAMLAASFAMNSAGYTAPARNQTSGPAVPAGKPAGFQWAGPYVGAYIGGAWGRDWISTNVGSITDSSYFFSSADANSVNQSASNSLHPSTLIGGLQLGDNWSINNFVYGLVLDFGSMHLNETLYANNLPFPVADGTYSLQTTATTNWLGTLRARFGWVPPLSWPVLIYVTGGVAATNLYVSNSFSDTTDLLGVGGNSNTCTKTGWTAGFGGELPLSRHWTINGEYLYIQFGSINDNGLITNSAAPADSFTSVFNTSVRLTTNLFRVALNYKF